MTKRDPRRNIEHLQVAESDVPREDWWRFYHMLAVEAAGYMTPEQWDEALRVARKGCGLPPVKP